MPNPEGCQHQGVNRLRHLAWCGYCGAILTNGDPGTATWMYPVLTDPHRWRRY